MVRTDSVPVKGEVNLDHCGAKRYGRGDFIQVPTVIRQPDRTIIALRIEGQQSEVHVF